MENQEENKIAIVGIDCRLPGANNSKEFWDNLVNEIESLTTFTEEELTAAGVTPERFNNPNYVRRRGVVPNVEMFDAEFFNFTPREAELLDPQHRIFLECAWHALEDSGINPFNTDKKIAVFGGTGSPYHLLNTIENESVLKYANGTSIITSNDKDYVTTRVSYKLNLKGPSINVQSACSTSMVSIVMGIDSLLNYQSDVVLAGGVTVELPVTKGYTYQEGSLESPDGKCRTFDKNAQGTVFSRGGGVITLKRLKDALEDNDHIYAVILGGAINNDGNRKAGYTAPSVQGQVEVITEAIEFAGINPRSISMVEAHGTATPVGDPIEVSSLTEAFSQYTNDKQYCALGSVKTNIGHTDVASGVASIIKAALSLKNGIIPASLNYKEPNPAINFSEGPFFVNTKTTDWKKNNQTPRRALVNSFGVGGTNACVILEEPPLPKKPLKKEQYDTLLISAHNKNSFDKYCHDIKNLLEHQPKICLNQLAHTSRTSRAPMKYKGVFSFKGYSDLLAKIEKSSPVKQITSENKELVFMFPGQGNQFVNMGLELYQNIPEFKECVDYCSNLIKPFIGIDIRNVIFPSEGNYEKSREKIEDTYITQPAIFIISYALANTLQNYGIKPDKLIGHSVGEYVAAVISGVMSLEDALKSVAFRGKLVFGLPQGSMLAVLMSEEDLLKILPKELSIAVINSPELVVVSGETKHIESFGEKLKNEKVFNKKLSTSHAFHSKMMEPCLEEYRNFFKTVSLQEPIIPIISTVTGNFLSNSEAQSVEYWVNHVIDPVRFGNAADQLLVNESTIFFECGPGQSLESAIKRRLNKDLKHIVISTLNQNEDAVISMNNALGKLWVENVFVDFDTRFNSDHLQKIPFPLLPFNRKSYMVDFSSNLTKTVLGENLKTPIIENWYYNPTWKKTNAIDFLPRVKKEKEVTIEKWIVFLDSELSESILQNLKEQKKNCYTVCKGEQYNEDGKIFTINPNQKDDYAQVFESIIEDDITLNVIYSWSFSETEKLSLENVEEILNNNFYNILHLQQGIISNNITDNTRIVSLINNGFDVIGSGNIKPEKNLSIGPTKVLFKEHLGISTLLINITSIKQEEISKLAAQIIKEVSNETDENIISYTGLNRWSQTFEQIKIPNDNNYKLIKDKGVYVITGGSGGIGRVLTKLIAKQVKGATIIWTGRRVFPKRKDWQKILEKKESDIVLKEKIKTIQEVENLGSKVAYYDVEVLDFNKMKQTFNAVEDEFGPINGVIHSAGVAGGGVVYSMSREKMEPVINPKVHGTLILKELLKDRDIDFIHLYSSITAILGEIGRVDYISGNSFMDACANSKGFLHKTASVTSINWGQWGLVGMAADWRLDIHKHKQKQLKHKVIDHSTNNYPLELELSHKNNQESCYKINIIPDKHWIFTEHLLTGIPTMVGTSYVDALIKWKEKEGFLGFLTLKNSTFSSPLMIMKNMQKDLYLFCNKQPNGGYKFIFRSTSHSNDKIKEDEFQDHFSGELMLSEKMNSKKINISKLKEKMPVVNNDPAPLTITDANNKPTLSYSKRWDCKELVHIGKKEWLIKLSLNNDFKDDFSYFFIHPAMLDIATSTHFKHIEGISHSYLPNAYGELNLYAPFEKELYAYCELSSSDLKDDQLNFNFQICNLDGEIIAEIFNYSFTKLFDLTNKSKKVKDETKEFSLTALEDDILPNEGEQVIDTILRNSELSQVIVYPKDLQFDIDDSTHSVLKQKRINKIKRVEIIEDIDDRPDIDIPYVEPKNEIEKSIAMVWTAILGINKIGINDSFNSLGGNSLLSIQIVSGINDLFEVALSTDEFVNNPTVYLLSELVLSKILGEHSGEELEKLLNE